MLKEGLSKADMRKTMQTCGYNANDVKAAYIKTFCAKAAIALFSTEELKLPKILKRLAKYYRDLNGENFSKK